MAYLLQISLKTCKNSAKEIEFSSKKLNVLQSIIMDYNGFSLQK